MFLPWYNKALIKFLEGFLKPEMKVFEYGSGNSTLYYSSKVNKICAIETRKEWLDFVLKNSSNNNIEIKLCENLENFPHEIKNFSIATFDIIVIDSRERSKCLELAPFYLKENGIIILDNSERKNLVKARSEACSQGFYEKIFTGERKEGEITTSSIFSKTKI